ncbi:hypothetical protein JTB14_007603 [Gonioctena quinquepunctata]|nr:hypothetical protein JTB14_007603 [Gonioctena quinquepunctata]
MRNNQKWNKNTLIPIISKKNYIDNTDSSNVEDEDLASIGGAEAKENGDPSYGGELSKGFTEKGVPRKRRKFENSPDLRTQLKAQKDKQDHKVKPECGMNCKKCSQNIPEERRHCAICQQGDEHIKKADKSRTRYKEYAGRDPVEGEIVFSVDLEKVIMLPRCDMFKNVIFSQRIIAYNGSFVPVVFIVNCETVATERIEINYFEPGHTYMSADSFHYQVEMSLKRHGKNHDFADFKNAVQNANSSSVVVLDMTLENVFVWQDLSSIYKINETVPRPYVKDIVQMTISREDRNLEYKIDFNLPAISLNFLKSSVIKNGFSMPKSQNKVNGINTGEKN